MKLFAKMVMAASVLSVTTAIVGIIGAVNLSAARESDEFMYTTMTEPIMTLNDLTTEFQLVRVGLRDMLLASTPDDVRKFRAQIAEHVEKTEKLARDFERTIVLDTTKHAFNDFTAAFKRYLGLVDQISLLASEGKRDEAVKAMRDGLSIAVDAQQATNKLGEAKMRVARETHESNMARTATAKTVLLIVVAVAVLAGIAFFAWFARTITAPLKRATELAASGEIATRLNILSKDELGELGRAFDALAERLEQKTREAEAIARGNLDIQIATVSGKDDLGVAFSKMVGELASTVRQIQEAFGQVATGASEISDASQSLSQGATEQASSIEEISSSVTEIGSQARSSAENAGQANRLVVSAREAAEKGDEQMKAMVGAMSEINTASGQIAKIIKVIDDIAFQTNLLALNAAVEAARAGKHGKGFAVVAEEVRNLAGRSAKAARETAEMIEASGRKVENGLTVAKTTSEVFTQILQNAIKTADLVGEIAAAGNEQAQGLGQISQGLSQIDQVTQRSTASAEELASAAQELSGNAAKVRQLLSRFQIGGGADASAPVVTPRAKAASPRVWTRSNGEASAGAWGKPNGASRKAQDPEPFISLDDKDLGRY